MSMLDEIEKFMNDIDTSITYRVVNLGGKNLYIEGIKSVISFGVEKMVFQMKKATLQVVGVDLSIKYLDKATCILSGIIKSIEEI